MTKEEYLMKKMELEERKVKALETIAKAVDFSDEQNIRGLLSSIQYRMERPDDPPMY